MAGASRGRRGVHQQTLRDAPGLKMSPRTKVSDRAVEYRWEVRAMRPPYPPRVDPSRTSARARPPISGKRS
jgi:hypothetical protein